MTEKFTGYSIATHRGQTRGIRDAVGALRPALAVEAVVGEAAHLVAHAHLLVVVLVVVGLRDARHALCAVFVGFAR